MRSNRRCAPCARGRRRWVCPGRCPGRCPVGCPGRRWRPPPPRLCSRTSPSTPERSARALWPTRRLSTLQGCRPATFLPQHLDRRPPPAARQVGRAGWCPCGPGPDQLGKARPAPSRPDQRGGSSGDTWVEAGGDHGLSKLAGDRLEHHASRMGHQHAVEWRQRILRHGIPMATTLGGLGSPVPLPRGGLAGLLPRFRRSSGSARPAASSMAGQRRLSSSNDRNGTRHAFSAGTHRAQGTARNSATTVLEYGVRTTKPSATSK